MEIYLREKENLFLRIGKIVENGLFPYEIPQLFVKNAFFGGQECLLLVLLVKNHVQMPLKNSR